MAQDDSAIREVDEELAQERQRLWLRRNGPMLALVALAVIVGVGGRQVWEAHKASRAGEAATAYMTASKAGDIDAALSEVAKTAPSGYAVLADLRRAGDLAAKGEREAALKAYVAVSGRSGAPKTIRDMARARAGYLALPDGLAAVDAALDGLDKDSSPFAPFAKEARALATFGAGDYAAAQTQFQALANDPSAPEGVSQRAGEFAALSAAARDGAKINPGTVGEKDLQGLLKPQDGAAQVPEPPSDVQGDAPTGDKALEAQEPSDAPVDADDGKTEAGDGEAGASQNAGQEAGQNGGTEP